MRDEAGLRCVSGQIGKVAWVTFDDDGTRKAVVIEAIGRDQTGFDAFYLDETTRKPFGPMMSLKFGWLREIKVE